MAEAETTPMSKPLKPKKSRAVIWLSVVIIILLAASAGLFVWQIKKGSSEKTRLGNEKKELQKKIDDLKKQLDDKTRELDVTKKPSDTSVTSSKNSTLQSLKDNIEAALNTKNTAALEGYMASSVNVVIAASEKGGPRTPAEAVSDLSYLNNATTPWNFNLPAATLAVFKKGFYGQYFGDSTVVGQSTNKYVASFRIDTNSKISVIFMAVSADLLQ